MHIKRKKNHNFVSYLVFILVLYIIISINFNKVNFENSNEKFVNNILQNSNYHLISTEEENNIIHNIIDIVSDIKVNDPVAILDQVFAYEKETTVSNIQEFSYIQNIVVDKPKVYIYSTHHDEGYQTEGFNVIKASLMLQEKLNSLGIQTIVEQRKSSEYIKDNGLDYKDSYLATRKFLTDALAEYGDFDLIIDLHRDYVSKSVSTTTEINGKKYAKVMFVMNKNYTTNYKFAQKINQVISSNYPNISRGIYDKYIDSFNQDLSNKAVLIELGTSYNTYEEIKNSIDALAETIKEIIYEG